MATGSDTPALNDAQRAWIKKMKTVLGMPTESIADSPRETSGSVHGVGTPPGQIAAALADSPLDILPEFLPEIKDLLKSLLGRRSAVLTVINKTDLDIHFGVFEHDNGAMFTKLPPEIIKLGESAQFVVSSPENDPTVGAVGKMDWMLNGDTSWHLSWDVPRLGHPSGDSTIDGSIASKYSPVPVRPTNDSVPELRYTLLGGEPRPKPLPKPKPTVEDENSSCLVTVTNETQLPLVLVKQSHEHGDFMTFPSKTLAPGPVRILRRSKPPTVPIKAARGVLFGKSGRLPLGRGASSGAIPNKRKTPRPSR